MKQQIIEFENKIPDASDFDTKSRSTNSKLTSSKIRQVHTETKLKWTLNSQEKTDR